VICFVINFQLIPPTGLPSLCSGSPYKILQIFTIWITSLWSVIYGAINFQLIPQKDCRRFAPAALLGARMTKKGKPVVLCPKPNGCAISKCIVHSKIEASFIFLLPLHFVTSFRFGH